MGAGTPIRAAQYVRMSTEDQVYSTINQKAAIADYADSHGFEVVRTYADEGRSGVQLKGRAALQELLADVFGGRPGYNAILVYDVSRWGRFQDLDEAGHLEFLCRRAGVPIHYCAEQFGNDGTLSSAIMKSLKRAMAGEYSRELSAKTFAGQSHLVTLGYKMGGKAGYGLRRMLVDKDGKPKMILNDGEQKNITTDRVILVPGPAAEVAVVRRIFDLAAQGLNYQAIAEALNRDGIAAPEAEKWCNGSIRAMLKAERYIGANVYNKRSTKLGGAFTYNPEAEWVRCDGAFEPIISRETFDAIRNQKRYLRPTYTDRQILDHLRGILDKHGRLTRELIDAARPPAAKTIRERFGTMHAAYARVGYDPWTRALFGDAGRSIDAFGDEAEAALKAKGHRVERTKISKLLTMDGKVVIAPRLYPRQPSGWWRMKFARKQDVDLVLAGLMDGDTRRYTFLYPVERFLRSHPVEISGNREHNAKYRLPDLSWLPDMVQWIMK